VANGPNIFQMLLVFEAKIVGDNWRESISDSPSEWVGFQPLLGAWDGPAMFWDYFVFV